MVVDGFDSSIDENLYEYVKGIADDKAIFFVDCFKMLSRNPEKVLAVIEYLLAHDAIFLASNYLLEHTSAEKRRPILKAASSKNPRDNIQKHLSNKTGLEKRHARYLSAVQI